MLTLSTLGFPLAGVGLLLAIDPILDVGRSAVNVGGEALVPTIYFPLVGPGPVRHRPRSPQPDSSGSSGRKVTDQRVPPETQGVAAVAEAAAASTAVA